MLQSKKTADDIISLPFSQYCVLYTRRYYPFTLEDTAPQCFHSLNVSGCVLFSSFNFPMETLKGCVEHKIIRSLLFNYTNLSPKVRAPTHTTTIQKNPTQTPKKASSSNSLLLRFRVSIQYSKQRGFVAKVLVPFSNGRV
jgi:hypothetical protein